MVSPGWLDLCLLHANSLETNQCQGKLNANVPVAKVQPFLLATPGPVCAGISGKNLSTKKKEGGKLTGLKIDLGLCRASPIHVNQRSTRINRRPQRDIIVPTPKETLDELNRRFNSLTPEEKEQWCVLIKEELERKHEEITDPKTSVLCGTCKGSGNRPLPKRCGPLVFGPPPPSYPCETCHGYGRIPWSRLFPKKEEDTGPDKCPTD